MAYMLALDYDSVSPVFVLTELSRLTRQFKVPLDLWQSSRHSYHIRATAPLEWPEAESIMDASKCSPEYKELCKRLKLFPIRLGEKKIFNEDGVCLMTKPATRLILSASVASQPVLESRK
jgi:hypothetical protein